VEPDSGRPQAERYPRLWLSGLRTAALALPLSVIANKKEHELLVGDNENVKELRYIYANQTNAMRAARAEWERIQRGVAEFDITLAKGRPELYPEQPTTVRGFKPDIDAAPLAAHSGGARPNQSGLHQPRTTRS
jgi:phage protein D